MIGALSESEIVRDYPVKLHTIQVLATQEASLTYHAKESTLARWYALFPIWWVSIVCILIASRKFPGSSSVGSPLRQPLTCSSHIQSRKIKTTRAFAKPRALRLISSCCFVPRRSYSQVHSLTLCCCIAQYHYFLRYQCG